MTIEQKLLMFMMWIDRQARDRDFIRLLSKEIK